LRTSRRGIAKIRISPWLARGLCSFLRVIANRGVRLLRRILRRPCVGFCAALGGQLEVGIGHLQIMFQRDGWRVAM